MRCFTEIMLEELDDANVIQQVAKAIDSHIASHGTVLYRWPGDTEPVAWPDDALYLVQYRVSAWPCDYVRHYDFFPTQDALKAWYASQVAWTRYEDNNFELDSLYIWDLGPTELAYKQAHLN